MILKPLCKSEKNKVDKVFVMKINENKGLRRSGEAR